MMKKNKLYTVNRFNKPMFMGNRETQNIFDGFDLSKMARNYFDGSSAKRTFDMNLGTSMEQQYLDSKNFLGLSKKNNPFSKVNMQGVGAAVGNAALSAGAGLVGSLGNSLISGGLQSDAGAAVSNIGGTIGGAVGAVNPIAGAAISAGSQLLGGLTNRMFGSKLNEQKIAEVNQSIDATRAAGNALGNATSNNDLLNSWGNLDMGKNFSQSDIGSDGWFSSKAKGKYQELKRKQEAARRFASHALVTGAENADKNMDFDVMSNFAAYGGPIDASMDGAIGYGFMSDYLTTKKENADSKNNQMTNMFMGTPSTFYDLGGDIQMTGSDYTTGLAHIDAGGSHEENPYDGVQMGVDREGTPNLVEEGETIYNDYVFSDRILADEATKKMFHLPKKKDITFAEISKRLEKEISERPNDPISKAGFKAQMQTLEDQQERQKSAMEAERARAAFEALNPEEQQAVMQQVAQQDAMPQQAAMQQPSPEEMQIMQQQQAMQADGSQAMIGQEPPMMAEGGRINKFENGGQAYTKMLNSLGFHTQKEFDDWAKENGIDFGDIWKDSPNTLNNDILSGLWKNENFKEALRKKNPALFHAFDTKGYDFGAYRPSENGKATIKSISKGNWKATNGAGWLGSDDPAWLEATKDMSEDDIKKLSTEDVAKLMRATDSYKKGTEWLQNKDNALLYLNTLLNDAGTPQVAKDYAAKFVKDGQWKEGFNYDYATVFGSNGKGVRETNPGTYWHTPVEATRGAQAQNWVINDDGSVEEIIGDVPTDWKAAGNYSWATPENDMTYNYYRRPVAAAPASPETPAVKAPEEEGPGIEPAKKADWMRYAGLFGPAVGLGMQIAGIGKPDYSDLDAAVQSSGNAHLATYKPIGNYLTYRPMDIWYEQNRMDANARATDRAIMNSNSPSRMTGLLASGYNNQIASGELYRKALEYNDAKRKDVAEFNRGTDMFNSEAFNRLSQFNASALNDAEGRRTNARLHAAQQKLANDAGWYNSLYGNVSGLFKGISDLGRENRETNWRNALVTAGAFGAMDEDALVKAGVAKYKKGKKSSEGGTVKRKKDKRGLTY